MDIETYENKSQVVPYLFILTDGKNYYNFYYDGNDIVALFLNQIEKKCYEWNLKKIEVYTHNINFDGYVLIEYFLKKNIYYVWFLRELDLYYIEFKYKGTDIRIRCSYKLLGTSVEKLGTILEKKGNHLFKKIFPHKFISETTLNYIGYVSENFFENKEDYDNFNKKWSQPCDIKKIAIDYAQMDVKIVYEALITFFEISKVKELANSFSFSSYSYKIFSKYFDTKKINKIKLENNEKNYIENAYFGGRTEIFGNTKTGIIHRFDFPGMYASCMKEKFPIGKPRFDKPKDFDKQGFYTVSVFSDLKYPILPLRSTDNRILYPNGNFTARLTRDEFILFLEKGGKIEKIHSALIYENEDYVFEEFVNNFEKIKIKGDFYKLYSKKIINSLYGSFALKKEKIKYVLLQNEHELFFLMEEKRLKNFVQHGNMIIAGIESKTHDTRENRNLAYAAFIAAKARNKLHKNIYILDDHYTKKYKEKYKLLYLETDSIDVSLPENCEGENIGDVTWQKTYCGGVYISPKFYLLKDNKPKIKGIMHSTHNYQEIYNSFYNNKDDMLFEKQLQFSKRNFILSQKYVNKNLKLISYEKRIFSDDKLTTKSLIINEQ